MWEPIHGVEKTSKNNKLDNLHFDRIDGFRFSDVISERNPQKIEIEKLR